MENMTINDAIAQLQSMAEQAGTLLEDIERLEAKGVDCYTVLSKTERAVGNLGQLQESVNAQLNP